MPILKRTHLDIKTEEKNRVKLTVEDTGSSGQVIHESDFSSSRFLGSKNDSKALFEDLDRQ